MINLYESYMAELEFKLETLGSVVRHATNCTMEPSKTSIKVKKFDLERNVFISSANILIHFFFLLAMGICLTLKCGSI